MERSVRRESKVSNIRQSEIVFWQSGVDCAREKGNEELEIRFIKRRARGKRDGKKTGRKQKEGHSCDREKRGTTCQPGKHEPCPSRPTERAVEKRIQWKIRKTRVEEWYACPRGYEEGPRTSSRGIQLRERVTCFTRDSWKNKKARGGKGSNEGKNEKKERERERKEKRTRKKRAKKEVRLVELNGETGVARVKTRAVPTST